MLKVWLKAAALTLPTPSVIKISSRSRMVFKQCGRLFRSSSMAEHPAVNRRVVSSSLTCGAKIPTKESNGERFIEPLAFRFPPKDPLKGHRSRLRFHGEGLRDWNLPNCP